MPSNARRKGERPASGEGEKSAEAFSASDAVCDGNRKGKIGFAGFSRKRNMAIV